MVKTLGFHCWGLRVHPWSGNKDPANVAWLKKKKISSGSASLLSFQAISSQLFNLHTLESPLGCKEIQPVHSEGDQPWDFFGRNDAKAEAPVLWPAHAKS